MGSFGSPSKISSASPWVFSPEGVDPSPGGRGIQNHPPPPLSFNNLVLGVGRVSPCEGGLPGAFAGAMGALVGHELIHGFDDMGRKYDADGNVRDWWRPADARNFMARAALIVKQFSGYTVYGRTALPPPPRFGRCAWVEDCRVFWTKPPVIDSGMEQNGDRYALTGHPQMFTFTPPRGVDKSASTSPRGGSPGQPHGGFSNSAANLADPRPLRRAARGWPPHQRGADPGGEHRRPRRPARGVPCPGPPAQSPTPDSDGDDLRGTGTTNSSHLEPNWPRSRSGGDQPTRLVWAGGPHRLPT